MKQPIIDTKDLKRYVSASTNIVFADIEDSLQTAFENFVLPVITRQQYKELQESKDLDAELLVKIKRSVANYAFYEDAAKFLILRSQVGSQTAENSPKLWQYQKDADSYKKKAYQGIETMLAFLEENQDHYQKWANSTLCTLYKSCFVKNVAIFQKYEDINESRILFLKCKQNLDFAQEFMIKPIFGERLYEVILSEFVNNALRTKHSILLGMAQGAMSSWAFYESLPKLLQDAESLNISLPKKEYQENSFDLAILLSEQSKQKATFFLHALLKYLNENVREYPQFEFSTYYIKDSHKPSFGNGKLLFL